jgi:hypothetical protein
MHQQAHEVQQAAAAVQARLEADWTYLQTQIDAFDPAASDADRKWKGLQRRREALLEQLRLLKACENLTTAVAAPVPSFEKPFLTLLKALPTDEVPLATPAQAAQMRRIQKMQAHADACRARYPFGVRDFKPGWDAALLAKQPRNPKAA